MANLTRFLLTGLLLLALREGQSTAMAQSTDSPPATASSVEAPTGDAMLARSAVNNTDLSRLQHVFEKARKGEKVTVAVIGGSITAGASATTPEKRYGNRVLRWWQENFPRASVVFVNAGVGATGSHYGTLRAQRDLLIHKPDFLIVEYAVNDGNTREFAETLEGLLRQVLRQPQNPAVMLLFMKTRGGTNAQEWHSKVGRHYNLPMVSFRDAVQPEITAGRLKEDDVLADEVHPNDRGHELTAEIVTNYLGGVLKGTPADAKLSEVEAVPAPYLTEVFEQVRFHDGANLKPVKNRGWVFDAANGCWVAKTPGSVLTCEVEGSLVDVATFRVKGPMGRARVQVDDQPPVILEGWFDATWGGYIPVDTVARNLKRGKHKVQIEVLPDKASDSTGHEFRVYGVGAAGIYL